VIDRASESQHFFADTEVYFSVSNCLPPFQKFLTVGLLTKFPSSLFFFFVCDLEKLLTTTSSLKTVEKKKNSLYKFF